MSIEIAFADIETDDINPSVIHMVGVLDYDTDKFTYYSGDAVAEGLLVLNNCKIIIGHNFISYDKKVIKELTDNLITLENVEIIDTVDLSYALFPDMKNHKLETWGEILGIPKIKFKKFDEFSEEMVDYCERDCRIVKAIYEFFMQHIASIESEK